MRAAVGEFGRCLRDWRKANRYTISSFSELADLSKSYVWELEQGRNFNPSIATLITISRVTGLSFNRLATLAAKQKMQEMQ